MKKLVFGIAAIIGCLVFLFQLPLARPVIAGNPPDSGRSEMSVTSSGSVPANGLSTFSITITLRDSSNAVLTGHDTVQLTVSDSGANVGPAPTQQLNDSGQATFTVSSNNPGTDTVGVVDLATGNTTFWFPGSITFAPTPTLSPSPTPVGTCNDATPATPTLASAVSGGTRSVTITWNAVAAPVSYYLVAYGTASGNYIYGNPNVGNVTTYTVGSLATGKTYYFAVKAVNGCAPSAYSNELSAAPGTSAPTPTTDTSMTTSTDQTTGTDVTSEVPTDTPTPTEGTPITPVPKSGSSVGRSVVFSVLGVLLGISVVAIIVINRVGKKQKPPMPPPSGPQPPTQTYVPPVEVGQTNEQPPLNDPSHYS